MGSSHDPSRLASIFHTLTVIADGGLVLPKTCTVNSMEWKAGNRQRRYKAYRIRHIEEIEKKRPPKENIPLGYVSMKSSRRLGKSGDIDRVQICEDAEDDFRRRIEQRRGRCAMLS